MNFYLLFNFNTGKPKEPEFVSYHRQADSTSVNISWQAPLSSVDFPITEYKITIQKENEMRITQEKREPSLSTIISGLEAYTNYTATVYSVIKINVIELFSVGKKYEMKANHGGEFTLRILKVHISVPECYFTLIDALKILTLLGWGILLLYFSFICFPITTKLGMIVLWNKISQRQ